MSNRQELAESWQRLDLRELEAIAAIARNVRTQTVSRRMAEFLARSLNCEADHREDFKTKPQQTPLWDDWSDAEVANGYFACLMIERACGPSERLQEWAELLLKATCSEMAARLQAMDLAREIHGGA